MSCAPATAQEEAYGQVYVWDAYLASTLVRCLFDKRLIGTLGGQVRHGESYLASARLQSLFGKCIVGKPMPDAVAAPRAQKDTTNTSKSLPSINFEDQGCLK